MDHVRAKRIFEELQGKAVGGWAIQRLINNGKSAVVLEGIKQGVRSAVKVFDPELVARFGKENQLKRIERECGLVGVEHPHLVKIFGGGECIDTGYLYVAMEFIDAPNLASVIENVPRDKISKLVSQIASSARFLEERALVHRDIKPENIAISADFDHATLLDLGVLRPFGDASLTDEDEKKFIGTLRYSSPEFLLREEMDTIDGWRANILPARCRYARPHNETAVVPRPFRTICGAS